MRVLLPPSETKVSGGGSISFSGSTLAYAESLGHTRERVIAALEKLCRGTDEQSEAAAAKILKLGARARNELSHNRVLRSSATMPAIERYNGVLFDALGVQTLDPPAREWIHAHVSIQSALFGLIHAADLIPAYRLSASTALSISEEPGTRNLPAARLKPLWREAHVPLPWEQATFIVDLRSKDYAALAPLPDTTNAVVVEVAQRTADGRTRALNHFNKQAKGDLVRRLAVSGAEVSDAAGLQTWALSQGVEMIAGSTSRQLTLVTELGPLQRA